MQSQSIVENKNDWLDVTVSDYVTEAEVLTHLSRLTSYLYDTYVFEASFGIFNVNAITRVTKNLFRGATQLIAWALMSLDNSESPFIIHDKIAPFQSVKMIFDMIVGLGLPSSNLVFVKDPNMELPPSSSFTKQLFDIKRKFFNGNVRIIGNPDDRSRVIIPLNYRFKGYLGDKYPMVIANYLQMFQNEVDHDLEDVATLQNISLFFGMYDGLDSYAELDSEELEKILTKEMEIISWAGGQLLKVEYASKLVVTDYYRQAEALVNNILVNKQDLIKDFIASDIALYLSLEGMQTTLRHRAPPIVEIAQPPLIEYFVNPFTMNPMLATICGDVRKKIETLRNDRVKFANSYAQYISFIFLNNGVHNPCGIFEMYVRSHRESVHTRLDLDSSQQKTAYDNLGIFLERYSNQKYFLKDKNLLEEKPEAVSAGISNNAQYIAVQPSTKLNFMPEPTLQQMHYNLFKPRRAPNLQAKELVNAVVRLAEEYVSTPMPGV